MSKGPKLTDAEKAQIRALLTAGKTVTQAATDSGFSLGACENVAAKMRDEGLEVARSTRGRRIDRRLVPEKDVNQIIAWLKEGYHPRGIAKALQRAKSTVYDIAKRHGYDYAKWRRGQSTDVAIPPVPRKESTLTERQRYFRGHAHSLKWHAEW